MARLTISDIVNLKGEELRNMTTGQLETIAKRATKLASTRKARALQALQKPENRDLPTPQAYRQTEEYMKRGKTTVIQSSTWLTFDFAMPQHTDNYRNDLLSMITKSRKFLQDKSSTIEGWKEILKDFRNRLENEGGVRISNATYKDFWEIYNRLSSAYNPELAGNYNSYQLQSLISQSIPRGVYDTDEIIENLMQILNSQYVEQKKAEEVDEEFLQDVFSIGSNR